MPRWTSRLRSPRLLRHPGSSFDRLLRLGLVLALVLAIVQLLAPSSFQIQQGNLSLSLRPIVPDRGGQVVVTLGPAGTLALQTHLTPVDLLADFRLEGGLPTVAEARVLLDGGPAALEDEAEQALRRFLLAKLPWALVLGGLAGALVAGPGRRRMRPAAKGAAIGLAASAVLVSLLAGVTLGTLDRTPAVKYEGLAANAPEVLRVVRTIIQETEGRWETAEDFIRGVSTVATHIRGAAASQPNDGVVRVLVASDLHSNVAGLMLVSSLARSQLDPVALVVLPGDLTILGSEAEGTLFVERLEAEGVPVLMVGGNHENVPAMEVFDQAGYVMLDESRVVLSGIAFHGVDDPQARSALPTADPEGIQEADQALLERFGRMARMPDVLVVHDLNQARGAVRLARARGHRLTVLHGHTHNEPSVTQDGSVTIVDAGTGGAVGHLGFGQLGDYFYTFQLLDFVLEPQPRLVSVTTLKYETPAGRAVAEFTPIVQ